MHLDRDKTIQKISSRIFIQHYDKCQRTNAIQVPKFNANFKSCILMPTVWHQIGDFLCRYTYGKVSEKT